MTIVVILFGDQRVGQPRKGEVRGIECLVFGNAAPSELEYDLSLGGGFGELDW